MGHLDCIAQSLRLILFVLYSADELSDLLHAKVVRCRRVHRLLSILHIYPILRSDPVIAVC